LAHALFKFLDSNKKIAHAAHRLIVPADVASTALANKNSKGCWDGDRNRFGSYLMGMIAQLEDLIGPPNVGYECSFKPFVS
jgi:hypothetical protein